MCYVDTLKSSYGKVRSFLVTHNHHRNKTKAVPFIQHQDKCQKMKSCFEDPEPRVCNIYSAAGSPSDGKAEMWLIVLHWSIPKSTMASCISSPICSPCRGEGENQQLKISGPLIAFILFLISCDSLQVHKVLFYRPSHKDHLTQTLLNPSYSAF